ncbi:MAG: NAD(P)-dependent alcohol dehydrogenase [Deltaproteobacteria bacterium]
MRAYELHGAGLEQLRLVERPMPEPGPGQVLVRVHAASLNYRDLLIAEGKYGRTPLRLPLVPLSDGAGEVIEVGSGVTRVAPGDRVAGTFFQNWVDGPFDASKGATALGGAIDGVLAEQVVFEAEGVVKFPSELSFEEAATLPCAGVTAWVSLIETGKLEPDQRVLVMGTGGVSIFALQFAKSVGAQVLVTSRSDEKLARANGLGADGLINSHKMPDWDAGVRELTIGRGVDHLVEVGGAETLPISLRALRDGGHIALVGLLSGAPASQELAESHQHGIRVDSIYVGSRQHFEAMNDAIERFKIQPVIDRRFPFEDARDAYAYLKSGQHFGKVVIRI